MIKVLIKFGLTSGILAGALSVNEPTFINSEEKPEKVSKNNVQINSITKFEDIAVYAKQKGCAFVFSRSWGNKEVFAPEEFVEAETKDSKNDKEQEKKDWRDRLVTATNKERAKCAKDKALAFFYNSTKNTFDVNTPPAPKKN